jgi:hypothetical protein
MLSTLHRGHHHVPKADLVSRWQATEGVRRVEETLDELIAHLYALRRDDQGVHATVGGVGLAGDEASLFEAIGRIHDRRGVAAEVSSQLFLRDRVIRI